MKDTASTKTSSIERDAPPHLVQNELENQSFSRIFMYLRNTSAGIVENCRLKMMPAIIKDATDCLRIQDLLGGGGGGGVEC